jgi:hypothetical protein
MPRRSQRALHKLWKNKTPVGFTHRVRWYQGVHDVRLNFQDEFTEINLFYTDTGEAQGDYEFFIQKCHELEEVMPPWVKGYVNVDPHFLHLSPTRLVQEQYDQRHQDQ